MIVALTIVVLTGVAWLAFGAVRCSFEELTDVVEAMVPRATMRILFVAGTDEGLVIDGLLDIEDASIGVPTTLCLSPPDDPRLRVIVSCLLQEWADDDAVVTVDLLRLVDPRPSVALDCNGSHVRLGVARRPSLSSG